MHSIGQVTKAVAGGDLTKKIDVDVRRDFGDERNYQWNGGEFESLQMK